MSAKTNEPRLVVMTEEQLRNIVREEVQAALQIAERSQLLHGYEELADLLKCSVNTARKMVQDGRIPQSAIVSQTPRGAIIINTKPILERWKSRI